MIFLPSVIQLSQDIANGEIMYEIIASRNGK